MGAFEGLLLTAYYDVGGVPTICYGETENVKIGDKATVEECNKKLEQSLYKHNKPAEKLPTLPDNAHLAFLDFCYNVGNANCQNSTLFKMWSKGYTIESCSQFLRWKYVKGKDCSIRSNGCYGVWERRQIEKQLCTGELSTNQALTKLGKSHALPDKATLNPEE